MAEQVIEQCRVLAAFTEEPGFTTRTFLSPPMRDVHEHLGAWMKRIGMGVRVDGVGNLRGRYEGRTPGAPALYIGSHLDTVPHAGAFDGILGVVMAIALVEGLGGRRLRFPIKVLGFSEEEGVRFGVPFIGGRALVGSVDHDLLGRRDASGVTVREAIQAFGLDPATIPDARVESDALGYLEFHIEQGPLLEKMQRPLGVVDAIVGLTRLEMWFEGKANHAGTAPMHLRHDALAGAAEWIAAVEREGRTTFALAATVGHLEIAPNAANVIAGSARAVLDLRHADDAVRQEATSRLTLYAEQIAARRGLKATSRLLLDQPAVAMDPQLTAMLERAVTATGPPAHRMPSGAGHDAMIMAPRMPVAMLFLRSPGGISHHPDESVLTQDVELALQAGSHFLNELERGT